MMQRYKFILPLLAVASLSLAYEDYDIDGVDDQIDRCPNTAFDARVDAYGCSAEQNYHGELTLKIGSDINIDSEYEQLKTLHFYLNYRYHEWDVSLSNTSYTFFAPQNSTISDSSDLYINLGYFFKINQWNTKISVGSKQAIDTIDENAEFPMGTGEDDYLVSVYANYLLQQRQNIFLYFGYTFSGDSNEVDFLNRRTFSLGSGYAITDKWYSALSYEYSSSAFEDVEAAQTLSWFHNYNISKVYFMTLSYAYALNQDAYDHTLSFAVGIYLK